MLKALLYLTLVVCSSNAMNAQSGWLRQSMPTPGDTTDLTGVSFVDGNVGTAVGFGGTIIRTTNAGATWVKQVSNTTLDLFGVSFSDASTGTAVGFEGTILRTTDAGNTWVKQFSSPNTIFSGVSFADNLTGCVVGAISNGKVFVGVILRTTNGGTQTQHLRERGSLTSVSFAYANVGTAIGYVVNGPKVFGTMLQTTHAGITWNDVEIGAGPVLFSVTTPDVNHTTAVGDSGTIIHTTDGGASWTRQMSTTQATLTAITSTDVGASTIVGFKGTILRATSDTTSSVKLVDNILEAPLRPFPNPANDMVNIRFWVSKQGAVVLDVIDAMGNTVAVSVDEHMLPGAYEVSVDVGGMASGVYYCRLHTNGHRELASLMVLR